MNHPLDLLDTISGKVCVVGSLNADLMVRTHKLPQGGQTVSGQPLQVLPGGKSANQAVCSSLLGCTTHIIGALGTDVHAEVLKRSLSRANVRTEGISVVEVPTGTAVITVDEQGENTIVISAGANGEVSPALVQKHRSLIEGAQALGLCMEIPYESVLEAARIAHEAGCTTVFNLSPLLPVSSELWNLVDVVVFNEHELCEILEQLTHEHLQTTAASQEHEPITREMILSFLRGKPSSVDKPYWEAIREVLNAISITQCIVTLGGAGAVVLEAQTITPLAPQQVSVVDTTGCGDAFMGCILACLASGLSLVEGAQLASYVAAFSATGQGAQNSYGTTNVLKAYWADQKSDLGDRKLS